MGVSYEPPEIIFRNADGAEQEKICEAARRQLTDSRNAPHDAVVQGLLDVLILA
jgi:hypothetical protein